MSANEFDVGNGNGSTDPARDWEKHKRVVYQGLNLHNQRLNDVEDDQQVCRDEQIKHAICITNLEQWKRDHEQAMAKKAEKKGVGGTQLKVAMVTGVLALIASIISSVAYFLK